MNQSGDCDPKIKFSFGDKEVIVESDYSTFNPIWNRVLTLEVQCENVFNIDLERALTCTVYDAEKSGKDNMIGEMMVKISRKMQRKFKCANGKKIPLIYCKPKWYPILNKKVDIGDPCFGHLLMGCAFVKKIDEKDFMTSQTKVETIK